MKKPIFWEKAKKVLICKDKKLGRIIATYPNDFLFSKSDPFYTLARSIVGQQISVIAADAVWSRLVDYVGDITPENFTELSIEATCILRLVKVKIRLYHRCGKKVFRLSRTRFSLSFR